MPTTWMITGCSSGFGEAFVRQLRAAGDNVIATGRDAAVKLAHLEDTGATILDLDVTAPEPVIREKVEEAWAMYPGGVDVVVNNAGFIVSACVEELSQQDLDSSMRTNFYGPINITRAILPKFRARGSGSLFYVGSQAAWQGETSATAYCAAKAALEIAVECLAKEMAIMCPAIQVQIVIPGYFRTKVFQKLHHKQSIVADYAALNNGVDEAEKSLINNEPGDPKQGVARMIEVVKSNGGLEGKQAPLRVVLGSDALGVVRKKCEETLRMCDDWEAVARSTDYVV